MKKILFPFFIICIGANLVSCSNVSNELFAPIQSMMKTTKEPSKTTEEHVGGSIGKGMDSVDKDKLSHALDKPLGKSTQWTNGVSGITYTVTPTKKVEINNNPFCREYSLKEEKGGKSRETNGTACVDANSNWAAV